LQNLYFDAKGRVVKRRVGVSKKSEMVNNFCINKAAGLKFINLKGLENGCNNMCHILIFVKSKNIYFSIFSDVLFGLF